MIPTSWKNFIARKVAEIQRSERGPGSLFAWLHRFDLGRFLPHISTALALFFVLFGGYILTNSGHTYTSDEETMLAAGESLVKRGSFALPLDFLMNDRGGIDGQRYSRYGPGQSVAAVPFIFVGRLVASTAPPYASRFIMLLFVLLLPALVTATTGLIVYDWVRTIGYSTGVAVGVALLYGTSLAWPYSRTFFAEPAATLGLTVCAYGMRREERRWWIIAGLGVGCAMSVKVQSLLILPIIAGYVLLVSWRGSLRISIEVLFERTLFALIGLVAPLALFLFYNAQIFGHPLKTGYGGVDPTYLLEGNWREGAYGLLLSTGKGILLYSPTILIGIVGIGMRWRQQWRESLLALGVLVVNVAFYSHLSYWHGDGSWGPRYMVFVLPFVYLAAAGVLETMIERRNIIIAALTSVLVIANVLVQLLPILVNFNTYIWYSNKVSGHYHRLFNPPDSPLVGHPRLWLERAGEWWLRVAPPDGITVLTDGFSYSEGERSRGELLPRWSYADARMLVYPPDTSAPLEGVLVVGDHRPWPLPRANFSLLLDGEPLDTVQRTDVTGQNVVWELRFQIPAERVHRGLALTLHSDTWNPEDTTPDNPRDEDLGVRFEQIAFSQHDMPLEVREALPIPTIEKDRRELWLWYYDSPRHHLFDAWLWFIWVAGLPPATVTLLLVLIGVPALAMVVVGGLSLAGELVPRRERREEVTLVLR